MSEAAGTLAPCITWSCLDTASAAERPAAEIVEEHIPPPSAWPGLPFRLPRELEASEPPEARGVARDQVRLMISYRANHAIKDARFDDLPSYLDPGDLLVINTSGTLNAALPAQGGADQPLELHLSTHLPDGVWVVELRTPGREGTLPYYDARPGQVINLPAGATATLLAPYYGNRASQAPARNRLWTAELRLSAPLLDYLARYGAPIHYGYVHANWPADYYQTVYATEPGSAEMPSAGRPFSEAVITRLVARGIYIAPLLLHTGVASLENDELPYDEFYRVPAETACLINLTHERGKRVVAVGTTVVRAIETAARADGMVVPGEGWTGLVITPERRLRAVNGLLTGLHEPRSTHLAMLQALAGPEHVRLAYAEALDRKYLWHEFGDAHLIL